MKTSSYDVKNKLFQLKRAAFFQIGWADDNKAAIKLLI